MIFEFTYLLQCSRYVFYSIIIINKRSLGLFTFASLKRPLCEKTQTIVKDSGRRQVDYTHNKSLMIPSETNIPAWVSFKTSSQISKTPWRK